MSLLLVFVFLMCIFGSSIGGREGDEEEGGREGEKEGEGGRERRKRKEGGKEGGWITYTHHGVNNDGRESNLMLASSSSMYFWCSSSKRRLSSSNCFRFSANSRCCCSRARFICSLRRLSYVGLCLCGGECRERDSSQPYEKWIQNRPLFDDVRVVWCPMSTHNCLIASS